jgi:hypothetical protein
VIGLPRLRVPWPNGSVAMLRTREAELPRRAGIELAVIARRDTLSP